MISHAFITQKIVSNVIATPRFSLVAGTITSTLGSSSLHHGTRPLLTRSYGGRPTVPPSKRLELQTLNTFHSWTRIGAPRRSYLPEPILLRILRCRGDLGAQSREFSAYPTFRDKERHIQNLQDPQEKEGDRAGINPEAHKSIDAAQKPLLESLPRIHAPSKEELLSAATGFWHRLGIRFKWFSIRSGRRFNTDDISAFVSWFFLGHIIWIIVGTTTFFSLAIFTINTVFAQETLAGWVGNYLTKSSGVKVVFESAIVPRWKNGVISFSNVFVSRRPGQGKSKVIKGSSASAAAAAAAAREKDAHDITAVEEMEDTNYTQYDLSIDTVNVTLSFAKWFNGKGLLGDVSLKGIRGVVDRTSLLPSDPSVDPRSYKHEHHPGDFEIDMFKMEDLLVTIYQPNNFRPFSVSIYSCELPRLRKRWLFYDMLAATHMSGSFDDSLFTIHPRQTHNHTGTTLTGEASSQWTKHSRIRIDGLKIDHLNRGVYGPFSWIHEGNVDIVADIMFPAEEDGSIAKVMSDFYDRVEATVTQTHHHHSHISTPSTTLTPTQDDIQHTISNPSTSPSHSPTPATQHLSTNDTHPLSQPSSSPFTSALSSTPLILDLRLSLNNVHATVPLFTPHLSYVNNALIRPIVAYINNSSKRSVFIPVRCRVVKERGEFDGSWTVFDSGLMEDLGRETYEAFARDIVDTKSRSRRLKKVGLWTIQLAAQALFIGLAGQLA